MIIAEGFLGALGFFESVRLIRSGVFFGCAGTTIHYSSPNKLDSPLGYLFIP